MKNILSYYHPKLPMYLAYMYQQVEYNPYKFFAWIIRFPNLTHVMHRQSLVWTTKAKILVILLTAIQIFYISVGVLYILFVPLAGIISLLFVPGFVIILSFLMVLMGWLYYEEPRRRSVLKKATVAFEKHPAIKIAIAGSYGKTTVKELLLTVLGEGRKVAATPGNKNVPISHAAWIKKLEGDEEILLIEFGEGAPGDIKKLAKLTHPTHGVITGLAPNHLDQYKHLHAVAKDLLSLGDYVDHHKLYVSSASFEDYDLSSYKQFSASGVKGWTVANVSVGYEGTSFILSKGKKHINVASGLLGKHLVAPLALSVVIADELGLTIEQIEKGLSKTMPYEHRMQPRHQFGAWIIDDTYNGSLEGIRAGLQLLTDLPAKRKLYVTPGLVEQGEETERVHEEIGRLIAAAKPDRTILMQNSTTQFIIKGLEAAQYSGDLHIEADPLTFYTNLEHVLASGDLIVMQNDWTDNYL